MTDWTRRDVLKGSLAAAAASMLPTRTAEMLQRLEAPAADGSSASDVIAAPAATERERLLLDANWRFLLGHAADPGPEFNAGNGNGYNKAGDLFPPSNAKFDASAWEQVDLPHDWAVALPFVNDPRLVHFGFQRFMENRLRERFGFAGTAIRLVFRATDEERDRAAASGRGAPRSRPRH